MNLSHAFLLGLALLSGAAGHVAAATPGGYRVIHSHGNPILADGSYYSADPAPLVVDGRLYILAGRDEAPHGVNDFVMDQWEMFVTKDPASGTWRHYPDVARPEQVFAWAAPGHAYGAQIVRGRDGRFYLYAPVQQAHTKDADPFGIGVAVSGSPLGPWRDAHPSGPIVSQSVPVSNTMQNIDPTVMVDADGRVYMYWGTFGQLRGVELAPDMVTPRGPVVKVDTLPGYFEAPWLFKRGKTYYLAYADNQAGPHSPCTPAVYHACIAYGTSDSPLGPWTYRGVILGPVSSTTSHDGIVRFKGQWYLVYHTADARGGGHFRRSVAIDKLDWDDHAVPARMLRVTPTRAPGPPRGRRRNIAPAATASSSSQPLPLQYWIKALNDETVRRNPLPPDMWASWRGRHTPATAWIQYRWREPVTVDASRMYFWADHPAGADAGVALPAAWRIEYWADGGWRPVPHASGYPVGTGAFQDTRFAPVTTRCIRAVFDASGHPGAHAGVAVQEWEVLAPRPVRLPPEASRSTDGDGTDACGP